MAVSNILAILGASIILAMSTNKYHQMEHNNNRGHGKISGKDDALNTGLAKSKNQDREIEYNSSVTRHGDMVEKVGASKQARPYFLISLPAMSMVGLSGVLAAAFMTTFCRVG